jgi:hypothetical protein
MPQSGADSMSRRLQSLRPLVRSTRRKIGQRGAGWPGDSTVRPVAIAVASMKMRSGWRPQDSRADAVSRLRRWTGRVNHAIRASLETGMPAHRLSETATGSAKRTCTGDVHRRFLHGTRMVLSEDAATVSQCEREATIRLRRWRERGDAENEPFRLSRT